MSENKLVIETVNILLKHEDLKEKFKKFEESVRQFSNYKIDSPRSYISRGIKDDYHLNSLINEIHSLKDIAKELNLIGVESKTISTVISFDF